MKKFIVLILSILCVVCAGAAAACKAPSYYKFTYELADGVVCDVYGIESATGERVELGYGAEIKSGCTVYFTYTLEENAMGEPVFFVNGDENNALSPDEHGVYSFSVHGDVHLAATGVWKLEKYEVVFDASDYRVQFIGDGFDASEATAVEAGESVSFTVDKSVYYGDNDFTVLANTTVLNPDSDGVYTVRVMQNTTVTVTDLELDESFLTRENGGSGTKTDPFIIERAIDLYALADRTNDDFWNGRYSVAYYKMTADIDMKGEQLYIIGDGTTSLAAFCGSFDGNGHTISNYFIEDTIIEQAAYTEVFMPYVGLFGTVSATYSRRAEIRNLNLENFTIDVNAAKYSSNFFAGGLIGFGVGVDVYNCSVDGTITVDADANNFGFVGGLIGYQMSAYSSDSLRYRSGVTSCRSSVTLSCESGVVFAAGGLVGYLDSAEERTAAYILNSCSSGSVTGMVNNAGGIVGYVSAYGSVKNCYSTGEYVEANNTFGIIAGSAAYAYAYAGGIAGYIDFDTVVSGCFSVSEVSAYAIAGTKYAVAGGITGGCSLGEADVVQSHPAIVFQCGTPSGNEAYDAAFLKCTLGWSDDDWSFDGAYPAVNVANLPFGEDPLRSVTLSFDYKGTQVGGATTATVTLGGYLPVAEWYLSELAQFVTADDATRSYGYFFDAACTQRVPDSYVPTDGETLYVGFADYSAVAGTYYFRASSAGGSVYLRLDPDGTTEYRDGALGYYSYYTYDGDTIVLYDCAALIETDDTIGDYYSAGRATSDGGILAIFNNLTYTQNAPLLAIRAIENFVYGEYYAENGDIYAFNPDGTCTITRSGNVGDYFYSVPGDVITVYSQSLSYWGVVSDGLVLSVDGNALSAFDAFRGVWEKSATSHKYYSFDGKGGWTYRYVGYNDLGVEKDITEPVSGSYSVGGDGSALLDNGAVARFDGEGFLTVAENGFTQTYYRRSSNAGTWRFSYRNEAIEIALNGIGNVGYGKAVVAYETLSEKLEMTYDVRTVGGVDYVTLFLGDVVYAQLSYYNADSTLRGWIYSAAEDGVVEGAVFCLYDDYVGKWIGAEWGVVEFNGFGSYRLDGTETTLKTSGTVRVGGISSGTYFLEDSTMKGKIYYRNAEYSIVYDEIDGIVLVTDGNGNSFTLCRFDRLYGLELIDADGNVYAFDGGGLLPEGGKLTQTGAEASLSFRYLLDGDVVRIFAAEESDLSSASAIGSVSVADGRYLWTYGSEQSELNVRNDFTGEWVVGGRLNGALVIGEIGASNTATGTYLGEAVTFTYDVAGKYLSFVYGDKTLYVLSMNAAGKTELAVATQKNTYGGFTVCIKAEELDGAQGEYVAADGGKLVIDGFGKSAYGKGYAALYGADGSLTAAYTYKVNAFGMMELDGGAYILKPVEGAFVIVGKAYVLQVPDLLYGLTATDADGVSYTFDGVGGILVGGEKTYDYKIKSQDKLLLVITLELTDGDGNVYEAEFNYGTTDYKLTIKE